MRVETTVVAPENALAALLDWYVACGVDIAVDAAPHDRFSESARPTTHAEPPEAAASAADPIENRSETRPPPRRWNESRTRVRVGDAESPARLRTDALSVVPDDVALAAREAASAATDLADLRARLEGSGGCALAATARFVFAAGTPGARVMVVDLMPGECADRSGEAFAGVEGRLVDNMLAAIGLDRDSAYLAYFSPWRSPGGREPNPRETAALLPFARRHVELAAPEILLVLGEAATRAMVGADERVTRGEWFDFACGGAKVRATPFYGLGSLLKSPGLKRTAWRDLRVVAAALRLANDADRSIIP